MLVGTKGKLANGDMAMGTANNRNGRKGGGSRLPLYRERRCIRSMSGCMKCWRKPAWTPSWRSVAGSSTLRRRDGSSTGSGGSARAGRFQGATRVERMKRKLPFDRLRAVSEVEPQTQTGAAIYAARKAIGEPVFGQIKQARGLAKVRAEWTLVCATHNILKGYRLCYG